MREVSFPFISLCTGDIAYDKCGGVLHLHLRYVFLLDLCFFYSHLDMWCALCFFFLVFIGLLCFIFLSTVEILTKKIKKKDSKRFLILFCWLAVEIQARTKKIDFFGRNIT